MTEMGIRVGHLGKTVMLKIPHSSFIFLKGPSKQVDKEHGTRQQFMHHQVYGP